MFLNNDWCYFFTELSTSQQLESDSLCWNEYESSLNDVTDKTQLLLEYIECVISIVKDSTNDNKEVINSRLNQLVKVVRVCICRKESVLTPSLVERVMTSLTRHDRVEDAVAIIDGIIDNYENPGFRWIQLMYYLKVDSNLKNVGKLFIDLKPHVSKLQVQHQVLHYYHRND